MKKSKILLILMLITSQFISIIPYQGEFIDFEYEDQKAENLRKKRLEEAKNVKSLKKTAGNSLINTLLKKESATEKNAILNAQPFELKEYLIELIENKKDLLNESEPTEQIIINQLDDLEKFILKNLKETYPKQMPPLVPNDL